ncbi:importin subunit related, putative [Babesia ovis]|uniref:Importin subunit related, putative n=1 Tax=Babesia ovis TaxID=5869 RepID=A0A9W5TBM6_BABOV|nr:importin subunit related, putative [Babesia ovis]
MSDSLTYRRAVHTGSPQETPKHTHMGTDSGSSCAQGVHGYGLRDMRTRSDRMVTDRGQWYPGDSRVAEDNRNDSDDKEVAELLPYLATGCQVRDNLYEQVLEGLQNTALCTTKAQALNVLRRSIYAYYGNSYSGNVTGKILTRESTNKLLTTEALEKYVFKTIFSDELHADNHIRCGCLQVIYAMTECLPIGNYPTLLNGKMLRSILLVMEYVCGGSGNNDLEEKMWFTGLCIIKNMMMVMEVPNEILRRILNSVCRKQDASTVDFCHVLLTRDLLPNLTKKTISSVYTSVPGSRAHMYHQCVKFLSEFLVKPKQREVLSKVCGALVCVCEYNFGIDLLMDLHCFPDILWLAQSVVNKYETAMNEVDKSSGKQLIEEITPELHQISFDALSVVSKMAFTANRRQIVAMLDQGVANMLVKVLNCPVSSTPVKTRAANTLGNLGCESDLEVQALINQSAMPTLIRTFQEALEQNTKIEAAYAICACASKANKVQIRYIVSCAGFFGMSSHNNCMTLITDFMDFVCNNDPGQEGNIRLCRIVLNAVDNILHIGKIEAKENKLLENPYGRMLVDHQGEVKLAKMAMFPDYHIAKRALHISHLYFNYPKVWSRMFD